MKRSKSSANSRLGHVFLRHRTAINARGDAPRLLRRRRPPRSAARSIPLGRPACLMAALWDGTDLSWPEERGARPTVVTVVDNAGRRPVLSR